jgi:hypothetical protein
LVRVITPRSRSFAKKFLGFAEMTGISPGENISWRNLKSRFEISEEK